MIHKSWLRGSVCALALCGLCSPLAGATESVPQAQTTNESDQPRIFTPDYFTPYAPLTALDMVNRIPGFSLRGGNDQGRGLGQGGANLLLNGARLSGKSTGPRDALSRISADQVVRIEIVEGATLNIPGLTGDVANIIYKTGQVSGNWDWSIRAKPESVAAPGNGEINVSRPIGGFDVTLGLVAQSDNVVVRGPEQLIDAQGTVFERADEVLDRRFQNVEVNWAISREFGNGAVFNFNGEYGHFNFNLEEESDRLALTPRGEDARWDFLRYEDEKEGEVSADYALPFAAGPYDGTLKLIGVYSWEHSPTRSQFEVSNATGFVGGSRFDRIADEAEAIGRAEYGWIPQEGRSWQVSGEVAYNLLDLTSELFEAGADGTYLAVALDDPEAKVEELRGEVTLTHNRDLSEKLSIQSSIGVEYSELSQSGAQNVTREFIRPKGFFNATYSASDTLDYRLEIDRRVGQLNFFDFIDSVDLQLDQDNIGNADLVPVQFWNYAVEVEKDFGQGNTVLIRTFYEDIEDSVDRIPFGEEGEVVGNIDEAKAWGFFVNSTFKGARWGWDGTELNLEYGYEWHRVADPLTGVERQFNGRRTSSFEADFRHDVRGTDWAYGFGVERNREARRVRLTEISRNAFKDPQSYVFVQHKDVFGMTAQFRVIDFIKLREGFRRDIWEGRRNASAFDRIETRERVFRTFYTFGLSGTF